MIATLCLLTCGALTAQMPDRADFQLAPQLTRGQELTYSGSYLEESSNNGVQFQQAYRLDTTVLVMNATARQCDVAILTVLSQNAPSKPGEPAAKTTHSVRLEVAELDNQGRLKGKGGSVALPLEGPPTIESGCFVEVPRGGVGREQFWEVNEDGRTPRTWRVAGTETIRGTPCVKLVGTQQSEDWDRPRADRPGWKRIDTVWIVPKAGIVVRVDRTVERREPARREATFRSTLRYELGTQLTYPGKLFDDRYLEIEEARKLHTDTVALLRQATRQQAHVDALLRRVTAHLDRAAPTPYRKAVVQVQQMLESAKLGKGGIDLPPPQPTLEETTVKLGQRVPDFVVTELITNQSIRLHRMLGRPVLIFFYNPATDAGHQTLRFAESVEKKFRPGITILAMACTDDVDLVRRQHAEMKLAFPVLEGRGLHQTFGVDATPRLIVLDAEGHLRGAYTGWGAQTPREVVGELQRWLPK